LSLERLFVCLHELLSRRGRDEFVRQLLLFHVLDMLEGLGLGAFDQLVNAGAVERRLQRLRAELPGDVARVALARCEHGLGGLKDAAAGFYLQERMNNEGLQVTDDDGRTRRLAVDRAVASYLQTIRNSTHSFRKKMRSRWHRSIFVAHTGVLHDALPEVAFLHVLHLLLDAGQLRL